MTTATAIGDPAAAVRAVLADPTLLSVVVQPIVNLETSAVAGYEVLSRVPDQWQVRPDALFATAETLGVSVDLTRVMLDLLQSLRATCPANCFLTANLTPRDLADDRLTAALRADWSGVIFEVTETVWPDDHEAVLAGISELRSSGAMIAADDVGAGYAGLVQLVRVRPDLIKVDRALVNRLGTDPAADAVLELLGHLASQLDAWLLVEGVETELELGVAMRLGVPLAQGWVFAPAGPPWPDVPHLPGVHQARARSLFTETVAAFMRSPLPGEVLLDAHDRPLAVDVGGVLMPVLTLAASTSVASAIQRSLHRSTRGHRLAPLAVTNGEGRMVGVVDVETLVLHGS